jgi:hypothetical protein
MATHSPLDEKAWWRSELGFIDHLLPTFPCLRRKADTHTFVEVAESGRPKVNPGRPNWRRQRLGRKAGGRPPDYIFISTRTPWTTLSEALRTRPGGCGAICATRQPFPFQPWIAFIISRLGGQRRAVQRDVMHRPLKLVEDEHRGPPVMMDRLLVVPLDCDLENVEPLVFEKDFVVFRRRGGRALRHGRLLGLGEVVGGRCGSRRAIPRV